MKKRRKFSILVILFNKEISESRTLNNLLSSDIDMKGTVLVIWNNGPSLIKDTSISNFEKKGFNVFIEETINNESLSIIYNKFIGKYFSESYLFLDDDSELTDSFLDHAKKCTNKDVLIPLIYCDKKIQSPMINNISATKVGLCNKNDSIIAIGSGIVAGDSILKGIERKYSDIFDERFYLYGVDTTFCHRLNSLNIGDHIKVIPGFTHSLSRLDDVEIKNKFRDKERGYDVGLTLRYYYPTIKSLFLLSKIFINNFLKTLSLKKGKKISFWVYVSYFKGKHYRNITKR